MTAEQALASSPPADGVQTNPWPMVSVVTPTHNRPDQLRLALQAISDQRYPGPVEMLVVFDREDPVRPAVNLPEGRELRLLRNERTPGPAGGYNTGMLAARGEFIAICDDDDEWLPDKLRLQVDMLTRQPQATVVTSGISVVTQREHARVPEKRLLTLDDLILHMGTTIHTSTILVRRDDVLSRIGLIDEEVPGSYGEDFEWLARAARLGPLAVVPQPLVRVRFRDSYFIQRWDLVVEAAPYILSRVPELRRHQKVLSKFYGRTALAHAAMGNARQAREWARKSIRESWLEPRPYLALVVSLRLLRADTVVKLAQVAGRGI